MLSNRVKRIGTSATLKIAAKAKAMRAEGINVIDLSVGEPDFPTPRHIKEAGKKAIDENKTKYTLNQGTLELREAISFWLRREHGLQYSIREIIVSSGAKHALYNLIMALVDEGDEVIITSPFWVSYPEMVELAGGTPVILSTKEEEGFKVKPERLRTAISPSTKLFILNNPSNPTGSAYTREELEALAQVIVEEDIFVVADEIYSQLVYDGFHFSSFASLGEEVRRRTIVINGVSKAFSMTGWRIGFAAGPETIISAMAKVQSHATSNPSSVSQAAAVEAFKGPQFEVKRMVTEFSRRRNYLLQRINSIPGISCRKPEGAFYIFPNFSSYYSMEYEGMPIRNSFGMAYFLLKEAKVAVVPGEPFGSDDHIRISYAASMDEIKEAVERIKEALSKLKPAARGVYFSVDNSVSKIKSFVPTEFDIDPQRRDALTLEVESYLKYDSYYEWNANISGLVIQLRTNVKNLYKLFVENFYPAELEADIEPHGVIYAVMGITGREPHVFYDRITKTGFLINTDNYAQLRSFSLGVASDISQRIMSVLPVRGMSLDIGGKGIILIGPKGTKKTELSFGLLREEAAKIHGIDLLHVRISGHEAVGDVLERKMFVPTNIVKVVPEFEELLRRSLCFNVVESRDECENHECKIEDCPLERGGAYCFIASKRSYSIVDPFWIGSSKKHTRRVNISYVFILLPEHGDGVPEPVNPEDGVRILERISAADDNSLFLNPHAVVRNDDEKEYLKKGFYMLFNCAQPFILKMKGADYKAVLSEIKKIVLD